uniref:BTB domain-containing protein n=1 Tax=Eptatretus burgeri TaxID=7764 RepID=A0A8C4QAH4_EPTBU
MEVCAENETMGLGEDREREGDHYIRYILSHLNEQRLHDNFTDIALIVAGHRFRAHKAVLAASSRFFHSFFKQVQEDTVVAIEGLSELAFGHLLEFIYTGIVYVEGVELDLVLKAAEFLQMDEAIIVLKKRFVRPSCYISGILVFVMNWCQSAF